MKNNELFTSLTESVLACGATRASVIETNLIALDPAFREMCASNACGTYGKCWMCPPDVGSIEDLMKQVGDYRYALVYQTVSELEDSFDIEGMLEARKNAGKLAQKLRSTFSIPEISTVLHLTVGGCGVCEVCAKRTGEPCRAPELAMASLEAYGVNVSKLAEAAGMKYINGKDTVTYFGAVLFCTDGGLIDEE
jgi:predicted metal-binding protein